ncbi:hypothetical protein FACS1894182_13130 [Bacteroidia bacterium]|nr:hypothetical protein FACS1894182_13130 [Bacteroidia bacterium]
MRYSISQSFILLLKGFYRTAVPSFIKTEILRFRDYPVYKEQKRRDKVRHGIIMYFEQKGKNNLDKEQLGIFNFIKKNKEMIFQ